MSNNITVKFLSHEREASCPADLMFPHGLDVDVGFQEMCQVDLPYPAKCCGVYLVRCEKCGSSMGYTVAGRVDDPRSVTLACQKHGNRQIKPVARVPHTEVSE